MSPSLEEPQESVSPDSTYVCLPDGVYVVTFPEGRAPALQDRLMKVRMLCPTAGCWTGTSQTGRTAQDVCQRVIVTHHVCLCPAALPLQTEAQPSQDGGLKDSLASDDSAVTDLSPKTDSSPKTETRTDFSPSTPGTSSSPQPKKGTTAEVCIGGY